jgi:HPt (histidine-containing phosphotransfer) domain-containing protein
MFVESIPAYVEEMKKALETNRYDLIKLIAHKVKPNLLMFGAVECFESIDFLNGFNEQEQKDVSQLDETITFLDKRVQQVCLELQNDLEKSKLFD